MIRTIPSIVAPRDIWMTLVGRARPSMAPAIAQAEAITARGRASLRSARPFLRRPGPAAKAPASATSRPAPLTKSR